LQIRIFRHNVGDDHVPNMNWVEGAKEKTDFQKLCCLDL